MSAQLGARLALRGLSTRGPWVAGALGLVTVLLLGMLERVREPGYAADRTLLGAAFAVAVPLVCYALFEGVYRRERPAKLLDPLGRHGADRRQLSFGVLVTLALVCAGAAALLGAVAVVAARDASDPRLLGDVAACLWGGALAGGAYAGLLAVGSLLGRRGRLGVLVLDWILGSGSGVFALPWPRAHARDLLGGAPVLDLSQPSAALALGLIAILGTAIAILREPA